MGGRFIDSRMSRKDQRRRLDGVSPVPVPVLPRRPSADVGLVLVPTVLLFELSLVEVLFELVAGFLASGFFVELWMAESVRRVAVSFLFMAESRTGLVAVSPTVGFAVVSTVGVVTVSFWAAVESVVAGVSVLGPHDASPNVRRHPAMIRARTFIGLCSFLLIVDSWLYEPLSVDAPRSGAGKIFGVVQSYGGGPSPSGAANVLRAPGFEQVPPYHADATDRVI
jgi:hypothetical protein